MKFDLASRRIWLFWSIGVLVLGIISSGSGYPTAVSPFSLLTIIPLFMAASWLQHVVIYPDVVYPILGALPITLLYLLWVLPIAPEVCRIPTRSMILFFLISTLDAWYFAVGWGYGVEYQGTQHTLIFAIINAVIGMVLFGIWRRNRCAHSRRSCIVFHGLLFCWLSWCAFPYLGELP